MAVPAKVTPRSLQVSKTLEKVRPGQWWLGEYEDGEFWARCSSALTYTNPRTGQKLIELRGVATDGQPASITQYRDYIVPVLTEAQAARCGLEVAQ